MGAPASVAGPEPRHRGPAPARPARAAPPTWVLLVTVNVLNAADAWLSDVAFTSGAAVEGNPVADALGIPGKLAVVGVASCLVARLRPRALLVPIVVLTVVLVWTTVGLVVV